MNSQVFTKMLEQAPFESWPRRGAGRVGAADHPRITAPSGGSTSSSASSPAQVSPPRCPAPHLSHARTRCQKPLPARGLHAHQPALHA